MSLINFINGHYQRQVLSAKESQNFYKNYASLK